MALMLTVLMGMAAFSVDVGNWYSVRNREQKAADAAALAAAIYWPGDKTAGEAEAIAVAQRNGFNASEVTVEDVGGARVRVTIARNVKNSFGNFLGVDTTHLSRTAVGEFQTTIPLGSPASTFGDEPIGSGDNRFSTLYPNNGSQPQFWANVFGPDSVKVNGDAHQATRCTNSVMLCNPPNTNLDYRPEGYTYVVRVGAPPAGATKLSFQVFDPAFVHVGDLCTDNFSPPAAGGGSPDRYASGNASPFCTGDQLFTGDAQDGLPPATTYTIREPDNTPWDVLDNPAIPHGSQVVNGSGCNSDHRQFQGWNEPLSTLVSAAKPDDPPAWITKPNGSNVKPSDYVRKWFPICELTSASPYVAGDYIIQVRTNAALGDPYGTSLTSGSGANRFSIRAAWLIGNTPNDTNISIFAASSMSLYANIDAAQTEFYLARILPGAAGRTLQLHFFDTGDASQPGDLQILPPRQPGTSDPGGFFTACSVERPRGAAVVNILASEKCTVRSLVSGTDNGHWIDVNVELPAGYSCDQNKRLGCWLKLKFAYPSGTTVNDTTTWEAELSGDPVRLVE